MDLESRLKTCCSAQELLRTRAEMEMQVAQLADPSQRAIAHVGLGHLFKAQCLDGIGALRHFQEAYKDDPSRLDAIGAARVAYRELGRLPLVQKLLHIEISSISSLEMAGPLYRELGEVLSDLGNADLAAQALAEALKAGCDTSDLLEDAQVDDLNYQMKIDALIEQSAGGDVGHLLRAAGIAARFEPDLAHAILLRAYRVEPTNERVASLIEGEFVESEQAEDLVALQQDILQEAGAPLELLYGFGARWAERHVPEVAIPLLEGVLERSPSQRPVINFLCEHAQNEPGYRGRFVEIARAISENSPQDPTLSYLLATAGLVALQDLNDKGKAREFFDRLAQVEPTHRALVEFREQVAAPTATHS